MGCDLVTWIKNPLSIWTGNTIDAGGGLLVQDSTIIELVPTGSKPVLSYDVIFDASELVIIPGLINCHHHFYQTLTRAFPPALNKELFDWLKQLYPVWAGLDEEAIALSTRLAVCELMLSGCTTVSDHHYLFHSDITSAVDIQIQACEALGVRAILTRGSMSLGKSAGGLPPDNVVQPDEVILRESERLLTFVNNKVDKIYECIQKNECKKNVDRGKCWCEDDKLFVHGPASEVCEMMFTCQHFFETSIDRVTFARRQPRQDPARRRHRASIRFRSTDN